MDAVKQRHDEEVRVCIETFRESAKNLVDNIKVAKVDSVKLFERNLILAHFHDLIRALLTLVNANKKRNVTLTRALAKNQELLESGRLVDRSNYSVNISRLAREVQRFAYLIESKNLEF